VDLDQSLRSVVALHALVPEDAFTAEVLGTDRVGSGVVINGDGLVLTIGYLVTEAAGVWLTSAEGRVVPGHALAYDQETGFGLVQALDRLDLPPIAFGSAKRADVGDPVALIGGGGVPAIEGQIVAKQEFAGYWEYLLDEAVFTFPARPSWSGAGLVGADGRLIGIGSLLVQQVTSGGRVQDINMVVPIDLLPPILGDLVNFGRVNKPARPWLGIYSAVNEDRVVVADVAKNGPAAAAGVRRGDIILGVREHGVENLADFYRKVWNSGPAGTEIAIEVVRGSRSEWLRIVSADRSAYLKKPRLQ
jgi:S1-C subfamily serine protease